MNQEQTGEETAMHEDTETPWYKNKKYDRYWKHYNHCFNWYQKHLKTCRNIESVCYDQEYEKYCQWSNFVNQYQTFYRWWQYNQWQTSSRQLQGTMSAPWRGRSSSKQLFHFPKEHPFTAPKPPGQRSAMIKKQSKSTGIFMKEKKNFVDPREMHGSPKRVATCSVSDISTDSNNSVSSKNRSSRRRNKKKKRTRLSSKSSKCESEKGSKTSLEMEITEDMLKFFVLSAKHKHERGLN